MQEAEKNALVKAMANETDESTVSAYLGIAASKICRRAYPFDPSIMEVPEQYSYLQVEIATYLLNAGNRQRNHNFLVAHDTLTFVTAMDTEFRDFATRLTM